MNFAIMRAKKLNGMGSLAASLQHCYRERDTPNADPQITPKNDHIASQSTNEAMGRLRGLLPEKRRKDAVIAVEYVLTASPEWWKTANDEQQKQFFDRAHTWLADKYGADRIITATIHRDETSPHLSAFVVPLTKDGRLSAKDFIGNRAKMTADQTSFANAVKDLGLVRGIEGSRSKHTTIQQHYSAIEKGMKSNVTISPETVKPKVLKKGFFTRDEETPEAIAIRLTEGVNKGFEGTVALASMAIQEKKRRIELEKTNQDLSNRLKETSAKLQKATALFKNLTSEQIKKLADLAKSFLKENQSYTITKERNQTKGRDHSL